MFSTSSNSKYRTLLDAYMNSFSHDVFQYANKQALLSLPNPDQRLIMDLFIDVQKIFEEEPIMLDVRSPCIIVGDIHGQILDLYRILKIFGMPAKQKYVFLGDFVDRGEFSVEVIIIVFILKVIWPDNVKIIRGNHEFEFLCSQCGFMTQMIDFFGDNNLFNYCAKAFGYIPLAARIDYKILCVHGGIGPEFNNLSQIGSLKRPIHDYDNDLLNSLLWSDPSLETDTFIESVRGTGYFFGEKAVNDFLANTKIQMIVRGHECVTEGVEFHFNEKICTVFSASNYCGLIGNSAGVLEMTGPMKYKIRKLPPLPWLLRANVMFRDPNSPFDPSSFTSTKMSKQSKANANTNSNNVYSIGNINILGNHQRKNSYGGGNVSGSLPSNSDNKLKCAASFRYMPTLVQHNSGNKLTKFSQSVKQLPKLELEQVPPLEPPPGLRRPIVAPPPTNIKRGSPRRLSYDRPRF
ncbi:Ser/Thr protein phosphatase [Tritrichomonas foetus]|uniref:Serine/threonine-protein phosphatase n=1 Tax=Tritrichomonas foetus TaxID=1144522 RepID=A0A1J4L101_9EUKA|nr:Ser/Thr protein phosphatase [Tritrichomonas foetus]|eukprot:OHT17090.1 Ser/Thr protein phosphatase [Tritrichomonas foetus]